MLSRMARRPRKPIDRTPIYIALVTGAGSFLVAIIAAGASLLGSIITAVATIIASR